MVASSFKKGDKVYIGGDKLLPIERFLPKPKVAGVTSAYISKYYHLRYQGAKTCRALPRN
jgi:hypothetical protein